MAPVSQDHGRNVSFRLFKQVDLCRGNKVERLFSSGFWLNDDGAVRAIVDLATAMSMVEVASILVGIPLISEASARLDGTLRETRYTVSPRRIGLVDTYWRSVYSGGGRREARHTMIMNACIEGKVVDHFDLDPVVLLNFK